MERDNAAQGRMQCLALAAFLFFSIYAFIIFTFKNMCLLAQMTFKNALCKVSTQDLLFLVNFSASLNDFTAGWFFLKMIYQF